MIHRLNNVRSDLLGYGSLALLAAESEELRNSQLELSFVSVSWFDANMSAALAAVLARILDRYNTLSIVDLSEAQRSILERNGFMSNFGYAAPSTWGSTIVPHRRFERSQATEFYEYLEEYLPGKGLPEMTNDFSLRFQQSLGEIFINAQIHSQSELGVFVCGQFFPTKQRLDITIADAGVGIPRKVSERFNRNVPAVAALRWALVEGNTTKQGTPGGVGLKLLCQFVAQNRGKLQIASGGAFWEFGGGPERFVSLSDPFPGTAVTLEVNTADTNPYDSDDEDNVRKA